jgi:hypothetical protein
VAEPFYTGGVDGEHERGDRLRSFVLGGLLGASAALAAARRRKRRPDRETPAGLAAFEEAPCYRELAERERAESRRES